MEEIFGRRGLLARSHPDYEYRQGQLAMASAVRAALEKRHHLLVEAGTGTGKTLAYLDSGHCERKTGRRLDRHKESSGATLLQGHPLSAKGSAASVPGDLSEGQVELCFVCSVFGRLRILPVLSGMEDIDHFDVISRWSARTGNGRSRWS
jgi:ATP-dependent DNA helicase DinG